MTNAHLDHPSLQYYFLTSWTGFKLYAHKSFSNLQRILFQICIELGMGFFPLLTAKLAVIFTVSFNCDELSNTWYMNERSFNPFFHNSGLSFENGADIDRRGLHLFSFLLTFESSCGSKSKLCICRRRLLIFLEWRDKWALVPGCWEYCKRNNIWIRT